MSNRGLKSLTYKLLHICSSLKREKDIFFFHKHLKHSSTVLSPQHKMDVNLLLPPSSVRGMTDLDRTVFQKRVIIPYVRVSEENINATVKCLKKFILKLFKLKPVQTDTEDPNKKIVLLNPLLVKDVEDIEKEIESISDKGQVEFLSKEINLMYENWKADEIIKSVLPEDQEGAQGYSIIGSIIHLNLREHNLPYKRVIGEVLIEKVPNISLVVNKTNIIDTTYRHFQMEVLAGTGKTEVTVKENGCSYSFDFAKVYWNPRLATEHERIVLKLKNCDILFDVMAGVGPFSLPSAKKGCKVFANDLNPDSYASLVQNCKVNKVKDKVECYNLDGHEFIKTILKEKLIETWHSSSFCGSIHVTMNLPAIAVEFLPSFIDLLAAEDVPEKAPLPLIHVYMFAENDKKDTAIRMVAKKLGYENGKNSANNSKSVCDNDTHGETSNITDNVNDFGNFQNDIVEVSFVRQVSRSKYMMRVSFQLTLELLIKDLVVPPLKKMKGD